MNSLEHDNQTVSSGSSGEDEEMMAILQSTLAVTQSHMMDLESDSESDSSEEPKWGGSPKGKAPNIKRDFAGSAETIIKQYFSGADSVYDEASFERRFGAPRQVVMRIIDTIQGQDPFILKKNRVGGQLGIRSIVRFVVAFKMLTYGDCADRLDDQLQISESAAHETLHAFCKLVVQGFKDQYYNQCPTDDDKKRSLELMKKGAFQAASHHGTVSIIFGRIALQNWQGSTRGKKKEKHSLWKQYVIRNFTFCISILGILDH